MYKLTDAGRAELDQLTLEQRQVVLNALYRKLSVAAWKGKVPYRYDLCAVCAVMGSSEENSEACQRCFIRSSCQEPFVAGFKEDNAKSLHYFRSMYDYMVGKCKSKPSTLVVGGNWDKQGGQPSKIVLELAKQLKADVYNGGWVQELGHVVTSGYDLIVWMPNIDNYHEKTYPKKDTGAVLVLSKVMREGYTSLDAAKRIFAAHGNAVIEIYPGTRYRFRLADALNNAWYDGEDVGQLCAGITKLTSWTNESVRVNAVRSKDPIFLANEQRIKKLLHITQGLSSRVENELGGRYFGNVSTRCVLLFPSTRIPCEKELDEYIHMYVSPRNIDKRYISPEDMVHVWGKGSGDGPMRFHGERKPSVDAPVQLRIYDSVPWVRYMIHGHAYIEGAPFTEEYVPCGDIRESIEVLKVLARFMPKQLSAVNLKNHGFLILGDDDLAGLEFLVEHIKLFNRL